MLGLIGFEYLIFYFNVYIYYPFSQVLYSLHLINTVNWFVNQVCK